MGGHATRYTAAHAGRLFIFPAGGCAGKGVSTPPTGKKETEKPHGGKKKQIDTGKLLALHKAGWSNVKIADELGISDMTVGRYLKMMAEEKKDGKQPEKV